MTMQHFIDAWQESMSEILTLGLDDETGATETSLPGWRIRDILAHLVHIEELLAYSDEGTRMPPGSKPTGKSVSSSVTQSGVDALSEVSVADLLRRLDRAVKERAAHFQVLPDPSAPADRTPGGMDWDWETLLRNRAVDAWMHEQDIRRALDPNGGRGGLGMHVSVRTFAAALPFVVGKRAAIEPGHVVRFSITGPVAVTRTIVVDENGRAVDTDEDPHTTITLDSETFARLAGGREPLTSYRIDGDESVADRILKHLAVTP